MCLGLLLSLSRKKWEWQVPSSTFLTSATSPHLYLIQRLVKILLFGGEEAGGQRRDYLIMNTAVGQAEAAQGRWQELGNGLGTSY